MQPYHHPDIPLTVQLKLERSKINLEKENIQGVLSLKHIDDST
jgi:hypothetical protein